MRGFDQPQSRLFTFIQIEDRVPVPHPLREVRHVTATVLAELQPRIDACYAKGNRSAVAAEPILRAMLLWALYGIPSELRLLEELDYNLLYRWFVGLELEDEVWARSTFRSNKERLIEAGLAGEFLARCLSVLPRRLLVHPFFAFNMALVEEWGGQMDLDW